MKSKRISRLLIMVIITLLSLIILKSNPKLKEKFYKNVFEKNISFSYINKLYKKYFGNQIPFKDVFLKEDVKATFNEKLEYKKKSKYLDGVKLEVDNNYLVPAIETGMVVYIGEKENYGNTVIIKGVDNIDIWYSNINVSNLKLYDYIEKGSYIGEARSKNIYLVYKRDSKVLNYEDYI